MRNPSLVILVTGNSIKVKTRNRAENPKTKEYS
jgi:hypothetical protein